MENEWFYKYDKAMNRSKIGCQKYEKKMGNKAIHYLF